jgi:hypothetical protein
MGAESTFLDLFAPEMIVSAYRQRHAQVAGEEWRRVALHRAWQAATERLHGEAQFRLGSLYYFGQGVPKNVVLSEMWFAARGHDYARQVRDTTEREMTPAQIAEAQKLARTASSPLSFPPAAGQSICRRGICHRGDDR